MTTKVRIPSVFKPSSLELSITSIAYLFMASVLHSSYKTALVFLERWLKTHVLMLFAPIEHINVAV